MGVARRGRVLRLVIVGGGHAHQQVVQAVTRAGVERLTGQTEFELVLISESRRAVYSGMVPGRVAGVYSDEQASVDLEVLCQRNGWRFIQGRVTAMDADKKVLEIENQFQEEYDVLSMDVGSVTRSLNGMWEAMQDGADIVLTRPVRELGQKIDEILQKLSSLPEKRVVVVGGGAAGSELALSLRDKLGETGRITVVTSGVDGLGSFKDKRASHAVAAEFRENDIALKLGRVVHVYTNSIEFEDHTGMSFDLLVVATGAQGSEWLKETGLSLDDKRFINVNRFLQSVSHPEVFAAGDCASFPDELPKAGVYAVRMGPILSKNLRNALSKQLEGRSMNSDLYLTAYKPQKRMLSLLRSSNGIAIGSKWGLVFRGRWVQSMKDSIDVKWINRFNTDQDDSSEGSPFLGKPVEAASLLLGSDVLEEDHTSMQAVLDRMTNDEEFRRQVLDAANGGDKIGM